jgi:hypothetical protein
VDQTRKAFKADVDGERLSAQAFLREELLRTLYALQQERIATMDAVHGERLATTAEIREERRVSMEALRGQEIVVMKEFEEISKRAIQDIDTRERSLINFFFLRFLELMLLTLVLCSLLAWVLMRRFVPAPRSR